MKSLLMIFISLILLATGSAFAQNEIEYGIVESDNGELWVIRCGAVLKQNGKTYKLKRNLVCPGVSNICPDEEATGCKNRAAVTIPGHNITFLFNGHTISIEPARNSSFSPALSKGYDTIVWSTGSHNTIIGKAETSYGPNSSGKSVNKNHRDMIYVSQSLNNADLPPVTGIKLGPSHFDGGHNKVLTVGCALSGSGTCFQVSNSNNYLFGNSVSGGTLGFHVGIPEFEEAANNSVIHSNKLEQNNVANPNGDKAFLLTSQLPARMLDDLDAYNVYSYNISTETHEGFVIKNGSGHLLIKNLAYSNTAKGFSIKSTDNVYGGNHSENFLIANDTDGNPTGIYLSDDVTGTVLAFNIALRNNEDIHTAENDRHCYHNHYILNWANPEKVNYPCVLSPFKDEKLFDEIETLMNKY